jgi:hypothetical protein
MTEAIKVLKHSEVVLMKKIKAMKDGKPKYAANEKLHEIRDALDVLKRYDMNDVNARVSEALG